MSSRFLLHLMMSPLSSVEIMRSSRTLWQMDRGGCSSGYSSYQRIFMRERKGREEGWHKSLIYLFIYLRNELLYSEHIQKKKRLKEQYPAKKLRTSPNQFTRLKMICHIKSYSIHSLSLPIDMPHKINRVSNAEPVESTR